MAEKLVYRKGRRVIKMPVPKKELETHTNLMRNLKKFIKENNVKVGAIIGCEFLPISPKIKEKYKNFEILTTHKGPVFVGPEHYDEITQLTDDINAIHEEIMMHAEKPKGILKHIQEVITLKKLMGEKDLSLSGGHTPRSLSVLSSEYIMKMPNGDIEMKPIVEYLDSRLKFERMTKKSPKPKKRKKY